MARSLRLTKGWTTHMGILSRIVNMTEGPVLELGAGLFSTPLLHWLCAESRRPLFSYDDQEKYFHFARQFRTGNHRVRFVTDWTTLNLDQHFSVVFIDHYGPRGTSALNFKDKADYILLHDSQDEIPYGYDKIWPYFKYRHDWTFCSPTVAIVSNAKDLSNL